MGSESLELEFSGVKTPPRLRYHALPSNQRAEPAGMATPPPQAPGSVPFLWEVVPGKARGAAAVEEPQSGPPKGVNAVRRLGLPMTVAEGDVASKTVLGGPYYVLLRPPPSLFDGPSVISRSSSHSCGSFSRYRVRDDRKRKERALAGWFWKRSAGRGDEGFSEKKKTVKPATSGRKGGASLTAVSSCGREDATAENVRITRFTRKGSLPDLSAVGTHVWASIYENLKQVVTAPWKTTRKSANGR